MDLNQFIEWQKEKPRRSITINIDNEFMSTTQRIRVWAYDYDLQTGQNVSCVEEIDLERKRAEDDKQKLDELLAKRAAIEKELERINA